MRRGALSCGLILVLFFGLGRAASGLTSAPVDFGTLVREAEQIIQGEITAVRSEWMTNASGRFILTLVTVKVRDSLKGEVPESLVLEFFGGKIGEREMGVVGMPEFRVGDIEFLFVAGNGHDICPLVGLHHGRFRVVTVATSAPARVFLHDGAPLRDVASVGRAADRGGAPRLADASQAMTAEEFTRLIRQRLSELPAR